jgi:ribonuclease HI
VTKMTKLAARARKMRLHSLSGKRTAVLPLQKLIGHFQSVTDCVGPTRLHSNSVREMLTLAERETTMTVKLSQLALEELNWWEENLPTWNGKSLIDAPPSFQFDTDASEKGWGAVFYPPSSKRIDCQGFFTEELTSNTRELTAVLRGITSLCNVTHWQDCSVRVRTDNQVTMSYVNRMGGREPHLARLAEQIHSFCLDRKIILTAEYLPGIENSTADQLSRVESDSSESKLHHSLFQLLERKWGPHTIDCLASATNTQLPQYISYRHDPTCMYSDLFSRPLSQSDNLWLFRPAAGPLIPRCLKKIERRS